MLKPPHSFFVQEVFAAKRADWAQVNDVASELVIARHFGKDIDLFVTTARNDLKFGRAADFSGEPNASSAHYASVCEQRDLLADMVLVHSLDFGLIQPTLGVAKFVGVVLEIALTCLIADRAIQRMIEEQQLKCHGLRCLDLGRVGSNHRALSDRRLATRHQLRSHDNCAIRLAFAYFD